MPAPTSEAARELGARIRQQRLSIKLSQEYVAHRAEMHVSNYGKIERGQANPSLHTIVRIAEVINIDPGALVAGLRGEMVPAPTHSEHVAELFRARAQRASA